MTTAKFISVEGIEGAGKSTALKLIQNYFSRMNIDIVLTREPGGTPLAEEMRKILLHQQQEKITTQTELLLMFAARAQHLQHVILPALQAGKWVVSDRYIDATYAYQGGGRRVSENEIAMLDQLIVKNIYPDLTLLLDIPVELGFKRAAERGQEKDRIEQEKLEFFERVRAAYLLRAKKDPARIKIIDASQNLSAVEQQIQHALKQFMVVA